MTSLSGLRADLIWLSTFTNPDRIYESTGNLNRLERIKKAFWGRIELLEELKRVFFEHLAFELNQQPYNPKEQDRAQRKLLSFALHMKPLIHDVLKDRPNICVDLLCDPSSETEGHFQKQRLASLFGRIRLCQKMQDLALLTQAPFPLKTLLDLSLEKPLKAKQKKELEAWVQKIQGVVHKKVASFQGPIENSFSKVRFIHRLLGGVVSYFNEAVLPQEGKRADLGAIEMELFGTGLTALNDSDPKHIEWRNHLHPGSPIWIHHQKYVLGEILENPIKTSDRPVVFAVEEDPSLQIEIETNESRAYLRDFEETLLHCGLIRGEVKAISHQGSVILRQRLQGHLDKIVWFPSGNHLTVQPIVDLVKGLILMPFTPFPLVPAAFGFDAEGAMRAEYCLVPRPKRFEDIEDFVYQCSLGASQEIHQGVFTHLMSASGLHLLPEARSYQALVRDAAQEKDVGRAISRHGTLSDPILLARRKELYDKILSVKEESKDRYRQDYGKTFDKKWDKKLQGAIEEVHLVHCPGSLLIPDFSDRVYANLKRKFKK